MEANGRSKSLKIRERLSHPILDADGHWLEFEPADSSKPTLLTDQETSQPNRVDVEYWATGLEPVYFEGAFERARAK